MILISAQKSTDFIREESRNWGKAGKQYIGKRDAGEWVKKTITTFVTTEPKWNPAKF